MSDTLAAADALAALISGAGVAAVVDVRDVAGALPCVLVPPPAVTFTGPRTYTWRLVILAADPLGSRHSWEQMDAILDELAGLLPIERADPISYALPAAGPDPLPAYAVTLTGS